MSSRTNRQHTVEILSVPKDALLLVRFRGPIRGIHTHWHKDGSRPCMGGNKCSYNHAKDPPIWKGYAPVDHWRESESKWYPMVLEVTSSAEEQLRGNVQPGEVWVFERQASKKNAKKVICTFAERTLDFGPDFDPMPVLRRMWDIRTDPPAQENDIEPALVLPPIESAPPDVKSILVAIGKRPPPPPKPQTAKDIPSIKERIESSPILNGNGKAH